MFKNSMLFLILLTMLLMISLFVTQILETDNKIYEMSNHINSYICDDNCKEYIKNNPEQPITILKKE